MVAIKVRASDSAETIVPTDQSDQLPFSIGGERALTNATLASKAPHPLAVENLEGEAELVEHLALPLPAQSRGAEHEYGTCTMSEQQLLYDEPRFDRLSEPNVIRDE
jgi:hypothetical protein